MHCESAPRELEDVRVVVADCYNAHLFVGGDECVDEGVLVGSHILCFVDNQHRLCDAVGLDFAVFDHACGAGHDVLDVVEVSDAAQEVEAVGMEGLYLDEVCGIAYEGHEALLELDSGGA